jgi:hypothetical protein
LSLLGLSLNQLAAGYMLMVPRNRRSFHPQATSCKNSKVSLATPS